MASILSASQAMPSTPSQINSKSSMPSTPSQINSKSSYALYSMVPKKRRVSILSPLQLLKAVKNETETQGMKNAHVSQTDDHDQSRPQTKFPLHFNQKTLG